jgi:F0F1-type ATP synthase membrane subunit b/b'
MAELNLHPNLIVTPIQMLIFLGNTLIVKKMILDPYLELKAKRLGRTKGASTGASQKLREAEEKEARIQARIAETHNQIRSESKQIRDIALEKQQQQVKAAIAKAETYYEEALGQISNNFDEALRDVARSIDPLVEEMYQKVTGQL